LIKITPRAIGLLSSMGLFVAGLMVVGLMVIQPTFVHYPETTKTVDPLRLRNHVEVLAVEHAPRNYMQQEKLNACAGYIQSQFQQSGGRVSEQAFEVMGRTYKNIACSFGPTNGVRIVVGAHYDVCGENPGADDNASGVAGLIELAHLLAHTDLEQPVELVAFTLEEPPFFSSDDMGSAHHAARLRKDGVDVEVMICLEMIGFFRDEPGSQHFPSLVLRMLYPDEGNYIAVVGGFSDRKQIRMMKASMRGATDLPVHAMCAPRAYGGMDLSDQRNYWSRGYNAVMVTDTAFFRNSNYHRLSDTPDTLDYERMAKVVRGVYEAVVRMANEPD